MRCTSFCVLELFLLNTLLYAKGRAHVTTNVAVVTQVPNWQIYRGETITLRCEINNGGGAEWEYEWENNGSIKPPNKKDFVFRAFVSHNGEYRCAGRTKQSATNWSDYYKLTVYSSKPQPVLTVSPSWLSPGDSVALNCSVKHPSAGWSFYWFKAVPKPTPSSYSYELLPNSTNGTDQGSYMVHGQTHSAGYVCRAGRGDPVFHTHFSKPKFVWSGDVHSAASLTVNPNRAQYFSSESVSLSCEGTSTKWRVRRLDKAGQQSYCHGWATLSGSTCNIHGLQYSDAVYWCESGSGEYSNAVNITIRSTRPGNSLFVVHLLSGLLTGALLVILLLFLCRFIKSKDPSSDRPSRSQSTNQGEQVNQDAEDHIYTSPLGGDVCVYESIGGCKDTGNDGQHGSATFHSIQLKGLDKRSEHEVPVENSNY